MSASGVPVARPGRSFISRRGGLMTAILVITTIGLLDAAYLTYVHYNGLGGLICAGTRNGHSSCITVQSSQWSMIAGVPVALAGLIGYLLLIASYVFTERVDGEAGRGLGFLLAFVGFGFSVYLTYREVFTIHAICEWCVGSAVCLALITILTAVRFLRGEQPPNG